MANLTANWRNRLRRKTGSRKKITEAGQRRAALEEEEKRLRAEQEKPKIPGNAGQKNQELRERVRAVESRLTILAEMEREHQGYNQGVKSLLQQAKKEPFYREIRGVVADLLKVEKGCELALEVALGRALQFLVIKTEAAARQASDYLKRYSLVAIYLPPLGPYRPQRRPPAAVRRIVAPV